mgnify:CR=1 FL=1
MTDQISNPTDDMIFEILDLRFLDRITADGNTGIFHGLGRARDQRMPVRQGIAIGQQAIGTGAGKPVVFGEIVLFEIDALGYQATALAVTTTTTAVEVDQIADRTGKDDFAAVLVFQFDQTTLAAIVAE